MRARPHAPPLSSRQVEDLEDISALEQAVDSSYAVLVIVSAGYFQSKNCMRELMRCVVDSLEISPRHIRLKPHQCIQS